jgi:L-threonylcarbamoyladenylate synthase
LIGPLDRRAAPRGGQQALLSPGLLDRHYAPMARVVLFSEATQAGTARRLQAELDGGTVVGALLLQTDLPGDHLLRMPPDPAGYARALYAALHQLGHPA